MDIENFKINCSQIGSLMGNARDNKPPTQPEIKKLFNIIGRDYGELSEPQKNTAREILLKAIEYEPNRPSDKILSEMVLIYAYEMYGKSKISKGNENPLYLEKANMAEPESIRMISDEDGVEYSKNEQLFVNKWFKGIPDVLIKTPIGKISKIIEVKTSYDLPSFIMSLIKPEKQDNIYEVMGYMDLTGCRDAEIVHCLVDMPEKIMSHEEKRLRERYEWLELEETIMYDRIQKVLANMEYSQIPKELKIFRRPVTYNKLSVKAVKRRTTTAKKWFSNIHNTFTKNLVTLEEVEENQQG